MATPVMAVMLSSCHVSMSPFSVWVSHHGQSAREWVYKSFGMAPAMVTFMPRGMMSPGIAFRPCFAKIPHGRAAHGGRKVPLLAATVWRINDDDSCHRLSSHPVGNAEFPARDNKGAAVRVKIDPHARPHAVLVKS